MTILQDVEDTLIGHFTNEWASRTPIAYENLPFNVEEQTSSWVRISMRSSTSAGTTLNSKRVRRIARIFVQVFVPPDRDGRTQANKLAEEAIDILETQGFSPHEINTQAGIPRELGLVQGWYQINVEVPFTYIKMRT